MLAEQSPTACPMPCIADEREHLGCHHRLHWQTFEDAVFACKKLDHVWWISWGEQLFYNILSCSFMRVKGTRRKALVGFPVGLRCVDHVYGFDLDRNFDMHEPTLIYQATVAYSPRAWMT